jgi:alpha-tubulin suppressor-like RCC1 family protein
MTWSSTVSRRSPCRRFARSPRFRQLAVLLVLAGCGEPAAPPDQPITPVATVRLSTDLLVLLELGTSQVTVTISDSLGNELTDRAVRYSVTNPAVASVTPTGVVKGHALGNTLLIARSETRSDTAAIHIRVRFRSISAGAAHTCGITVANRVYCWGKGAMGRLGTGSDANSAIPALVQAPGPFSLVRAGGVSTCGLAGSRAYCWGSNDARQLGTGLKTDTWIPLSVAGEHDFGALTVGTSHACGVTSSGAGLCWGADWGGQIGNGLRPRPFEPDSVAGDMSFMAIATGWSFSCGLTELGAPYCWGRNEADQLGLPDADETCMARGGAIIPCTTDPLAVGTTERFVSLTAAGLHACALTADGRAFCWGDNAVGQRGDGTTAPSAVPTSVIGDLTFVQLTAGERHVCGVTADGHAYCWGDNSSLALGTADAVAGCAGVACSPVPVRAAAPLSFTVLSASAGLGGGHTCGITTEGHAYCWGRNADGQLGTGKWGGARRDPVPVWGQWDLETSSGR